MRDVEEDQIYKTLALKDLRADPSLMFKKMLVAGAMFWYIGDGTAKTFLNMAVRLPVLFLALIGFYLHRRDKAWAVWMAVVLAGVYYAAHLPFGAPARLSTPIIPLLTVFAAAATARLLRPLIQGRRRS